MIKNERRTKQIIRIYRVYLILLIIFVFGSILLQEYGIYTYEVPEIIWILFVGLNIFIMGVVGLLTRSIIFKTLGGAVNYDSAPTVGIIINIIVCLMGLFFIIFFLFF